MGWYEELEGPVARPSGQSARRLTEYGLDEATAADESVLSGESASAALVDAFSGRFSLFDDAGLTTAAELEAQINRLGDDQFAIFANEALIELEECTGCPRR